MSRRYWTWAILFLVATKTALADKPVVQLDFGIKSDTLSRLLKKDGTDRTSDVTAAVLAELQQKAVAYFPFVEWSVTPVRGAAGRLYVEVFEQAIPRAPSDYYLRYWNAATNIQIKIGLSKPFIPSGDAHQPSSDESLKKRVKQQIDDDLDAAADADMVSFFLCKILVMKAPPGQREIAVIDDGVLKLPMLWETLLADGDVSILRVQLWSQKPNHPNASEGLLILKDPKKCGCDSKSVQASVDDFKYPGLVLQPGQWTPEASDVLTPARLKEFRVFVTKYRKSSDTEESSK